MTDDLISFYFRCKNLPKDTVKDDTTVSNSREVDPLLKADIDKIKTIYSDFIPVSDTIINKINHLDSFTKQNTAIKPENDTKKDAAMLSFSTIPFVRRFFCVKDALDNGDTIKSLGKMFIQVINIKCDCNDIKTAFKELLHLDFKKYQYQKPFGFFRDTYLENIKSSNETVMKILDKAYHIDKTFYDLRPVKKLLNALGNQRPEYLGECIKINGNMFVKIIGRAFLRIPVLTPVFLSMLEIPTIYKSENKKKQIVKSAITVTSFTLCGAIFGAIGAYVGMIGSLAGLGIGSYLGNKLAKKINSKF